MQNGMNSNVIKAELSDEKPHFCAKCDKQIQDRYFLKALNLFWHEDCLKCGCCDCRLGDVGTTLFTRENFLLCKSDYMRLYGNTGLCAACNKLIPAFEMVMRAKRNVYHLECFACQQCNHRFCVGDRFYLCDNKILCDNDYEDRQMRTQNNGQASNGMQNSNNNNIESINHNLKCSGNETKSSSPLKRYGSSNNSGGGGSNHSNAGSTLSAANNQNNSMSPFHTNDFLNYDDVRRGPDMPIIVR